MTIIDFEYIYIYSTVTDNDILQEKKNYKNTHKIVLLIHNSFWRGVCVCVAAERRLLQRVSDVKSRPLVRKKTRQNDIFATIFTRETGTYRVTFLFSPEVYVIRYYVNDIRVLYAVKNA